MAAGLSRRVVRILGLWGTVLVQVGPNPAVADAPRPLSRCRALIQADPRSLEGYACLLPNGGTHRKEVLALLEERLRRDPADPRPRLYRALIRELAGQEVDDGEWALARDGFAREHDLTGEVYALTSHIGARCFGRMRCDDEVRSMLWRAGELARASGKPELLQLVEIWRMKHAFAHDDLGEAEASEARLLSLGEPSAPWLAAESLQARAHLAASVLNYPQERKLYAELVRKLSLADPRRALALGGMATGAVHLALVGLESREAAERMVREAIAEQERLALPLYWPENGYLTSRVELALLLGPTPEAFALLRATLAEHRLRGGWRTPLFSLLALGELLATSEPPQLAEALRTAQDAVEEAWTHGGELEQAWALVLRSRMRFRVGQLTAARADALAALDRLERLREIQREVPLKVRYAESHSFAYRSLAGALLAHRTADERTPLEDAFGVMERLRARALMETLLAESRGGSLEGTAPPVTVPALGQIQAALAPDEALLSFQVWRPEPIIEAPYRDGSSWVTVLTREKVEAFRIPDADVLEPQIRAWTGLLDRRDGSDRLAGARLHAELLGPALAALPARVDRLVLIPDGPLHRLPFDALAAGPGVPYLAERFEVSIAPSASLWRRLRAPPGPPAGTVLVLADPAASTGPPAVLRDGPGTFAALVHARREAEAALGAFPAGSELRLGAPASESFLKSASLEGVSLLHLATHAVADERDPERAAVVLAAGSPAEDGRLEPREISRLPLVGRTVVLAGCETSAGAVFRGEGVMSLARAFFAAGAIAVVGTLDRARDDEAAVFFTSMYRALGGGATIGEAVASAKREGILRGAPPAAWAGVVLLGSSDARPRAARWPAALSLGLTGAVVAFAGVGAGRWWRRRGAPGQIPAHRKG